MIAYRAETSLVNIIKLKSPEVSCSEIDPTFAEPYDFRGWLKLFWGDRNGACEDFRKAIILRRPGMFERVRNCD